MRTHLAAACIVPLLLGSMLAHAPASAQPGPPNEQKGSAPMRGWHQGMGGMGGWGMMNNWGMMGPDWRALDLSAEQRKKIEAIRRELRDKQFALMDQMHDSMHSTSFYRGGSFDEQAARRAYQTVEKMHRQMFENMLDAQKRMDALLSPQQRQQLGRDKQ